MSDTESSEIGSHRKGFMTRPQETDTILVVGGAPPEWFGEAAADLGLVVRSGLDAVAAEDSVVAYVMNSYGDEEPAPADGGLVERYPCLRVVVYQGQSLEPGDYEAYADLEALRGAGVPLATTPAGDPVAESAFALLSALDLDLVALATNPTAVAQQRRGLRGRTLGIVGLGQIGSQVAVFAHCAGMQVVYASRSRHRDVEQEIGATRMPLSDVFECADYVSVHLPTSAPKGLVDASILIGARDVILVNTTSAPGIVDASALLAALQNDNVSRAAVEGKYPSPWQERLAKLGPGRFISLPAYTSWDTPGARAAGWQQSLDAVRAAITGQRIDHGIA